MDIRARRTRREMRQAVRGEGYLGAVGKVPSLKGLQFTCDAYPALTRWATIVTPFGLRIVVSHPFAKAAACLSRSSSSPASGCRVA